MFAKTMMLVLRLAMGPVVEGFLTKTYTQCMDRSGGVTAAMMDCRGAEYARQDAVLNRNYQALLKAYAKEPAMVAKLRAAQ